MCCWISYQIYRCLYWDHPVEVAGKISISVNIYWKARMSVRLYIAPISKISTGLYPPWFADVILEQKVSCLMTYTTRFRLSKYAFLLSWGIYFGGLELYSRIFWHDLGGHGWFQRGFNWDFVGYTYYWEHFWYFSQDLRCFWDI